MAEKFDEQIGEILCSLELPQAWRHHMAQLAVRSQVSAGLHELQDKRRRLGVAYADGVFSDRIYKIRLQEIDARIREATSNVPSSVEDAVELFENIEWLWKETTWEEKRKLVSPLIERVYVNLELKQVGAIVPSPAFRALLQCAVRKSRSEVVLVGSDDLEGPENWSWWRRGGIEPPVQKKYVQDLLQAYPGI